MFLTGQHALIIRCTLFYVFFAQCVRIVESHTHYIRFIDGKADTVSIIRKGGVSKDDLYYISHE